MTQSDNTSPYKASIYDDRIRQTVPFYDEIHQQTVDLVKTVKPGVKVWLDSGCGTGHLVQAALPLFPETRFILSDSSEAMLSQAMKRLGGKPRTRVEFLRPVRNEQLTWCSDSSNPEVITSILCNHYLESRQRHEAVRACHDLLVHGGIFITFENIDSFFCRGAEIALGRWKRYQVGQGRPGSEAGEHIMRFKTKYFPITIDEHLNLLKTVGFRVVEIFWLSHMQAGFYAIK